MSAGILSNHEVCAGAEVNDEQWRQDMSAGNHIDGGGASTNIGFHIRVPFTVTVPGDYNFRLHADCKSTRNLRLLVICASTLTECL